MVSALQEFKNLFGRGFLLGVFSPVLIFMGTSLALYYEITQGVGTALAQWERLSLQNQVLSILVVIIVITVLAYLIYNFQYSITRLFEGYWPRIRILDIIRNRRIELYRRRWEYLEALVQSEGILSEPEKAGILGEQLTYYPPRRNNLDKLLPTRLGNILRASEIYPYDRYGIDAVVIWTRLHPFLTQEVLEPLENNQTTIDFMLLMSVFAATFTLVWCPLLAYFTNRWELFLICSLGWPLAWVCYQNAVQRALVYSEQFKAIFDLHRYDLLKTLDLTAEVDRKREQWKNISDFFQYGMPIPLSSVDLEKLKGWDQVAMALAEYIRRKNRPKP